jgi:hypothetical protein
MGRVFLSPRMGVRATTERWRRLGRTARDHDGVALGQLAGMAMAHASEGFFAFDDPLEAATVPVLAELARGRTRVAPARNSGLAAMLRGIPPP